MRFAPRALDGLAALGGPASRDALVSLAGDDHPTPARVAAIAALVSLDVDRAAAMATVLLVHPPDGLDSAAAAHRAARSSARAGGVDRCNQGQTIPSDTAKLALREVRDSGLADADLLAALQTAGGLKAAVDQTFARRDASLGRPGGRRG